MPIPSFKAKRQRRAIMHYYVDFGEVGLGVLAGMLVVSLVVIAGFAFA